MYWSAIQHGASIRRLISTRLSGTAKVALIAGAFAANLILSPARVCATQPAPTTGQDSHFHSPPVTSRTGAEEPWPGLPMLNYVFPSADLRHVLMTLASEGELEPSDLEKLDFTYPSDPGFGSNPAFEVFNPSSRFQKVATRNGTSSLKPDRQQAIDEVTNHTHLRPLYNLRRVTAPDGTITDTLYRIIPDVKKEQCDELATRIENPGTGKSPRGIESLNYVTASNNHQVITDSSPLPDIFEAVCIQMSDGKLYTFTDVIRRVQKAGSQTWQIQ